MKFKYIVLIFCGLLLSVSCNKKKTTTYYIDSEFKEWVLFQKGSFWVYLNEKNQVQDCTFIENFPRHAISMPGMIGPDSFESYYYLLSNGFISDVYLKRNYNSSDASLMCFFPGGVEFNGLSTINFETPSNTSFQYPFLVEKIDSIFINNNKFVNVYHTRDTIAYYDNLQHDYYYVRNVGLVKFSIRTNSFDSTWSLVRWHTIQ